MEFSLLFSLSRCGIQRIGRTAQAPGRRDGEACNFPERMRMGKCMDFCCWENRERDRTLIFRDWIRGGIVVAASPSLVSMITTTMTIMVCGIDEFDRQFGEVVPSSFLFPFLLGPNSLRECVGVISRPLDLFHEWSLSIHDLHASTAAKA
jgi:hypothetical protein